MCSNISMVNSDQKLGCEICWWMASAWRRFWIIELPIVDFAFAESWFTNYWLRFQFERSRLPAGNQENNLIV
jgi:hypothetical protein